MGGWCVDAPCGTTAAYKRHRRRGETPCHACRSAVAKARRIQRRGGSVITPQPTPEERFWSRVVVDPNTTCLVWTGSIGTGGYGRHRWANSPKFRQSHRIAYELTVGPIPVGLMLDHLCRNRICCNPAHLEPVTPYENHERGLGIAAVMQRAAARRRAGGLA